MRPALIPPLLAIAWGLNWPAVKTIFGNSPEFRKSGPFRWSSRLRWFVKTLAVSTSMRTSDSVPVFSSNW